VVRVASLHVYPIKSLGGASVAASTVDGRGLRHDRRWMLVDETGTFLSQRTIAPMALFRVGLFPDRLDVTGPTGDVLSIPHVTAAERIPVRVWNSEVEAARVSDAADAWFTAQMERPARLVYMPDDVVRPTHPDYTLPGDRVGFADAFPVLVAGEASLDDLNSRLETPIPMNRFRPNIVVTGSEPYAEDEWPAFVLGGVRYRRAKRCGRCRVTTTNQDTAEVGVEPLRTLATYRRDGNSVQFGTYFVPESEGAVAVGESLVVPS
jgi:uncharacterized protein YcbX